MKKQIEIEHRARFSEKQHNVLFEFLKKNGKDLGKDDKNVYFFVFPDKILKVTDNISKKTAKITGKLSKIGEGSAFEEIEFPISPADVKKAVKLFKLFGLGNMHESFQKRHNFRYKGVEISVKYSKIWGYHAEFEILINNKKKKKTADEKIINVAKELGINLMTEKELKSFIKKIEKN